MGKKHRKKVGVQVYMEPEQRQALKEIQDECDLPLAELHRQGLSAVIAMYSLKGRDAEQALIQQAEQGDDVVRPDDEWQAAAGALGRQCRALSEGVKSLYVKLEAERSDYNTLWKRHQLTRNALHHIKAKVDNLLGYPTHEEDDPPEKDL